MKLKKTIIQIQEDLTSVRKGMEGMVGLYHDLVRSIGSLPDPPDMSEVDFESAASVFRHYNSSDIKALIPFAEPNFAGPLYYSVLIGISGMSGLKYGHGHTKRSFLKFVEQDMLMSSEIAELLYLCRKEAFATGFWPNGTAINAKDSEHVFRIRKEVITIYVIPLAFKYLAAIENLDISDIKTDLPTIGNSDIVTKALGHLKEFDYVSESKSKA